MGGGNTLMRDFTTIITETSPTICLYFQEATYSLPEEEVSLLLTALYVNGIGKMWRVICRC